MATCIITGIISPPATSIISSPYIATHTVRALWVRDTIQSIVYNLPRGLLEFCNWQRDHQNGLSEDQVDQTYSPMQFLEGMHCQSSTIIPSEFLVKALLPSFLHRGPHDIPQRESCGNLLSTVYYPGAKSSSH